MIERLIKIIPVWIHRFNEPELPRPIPFLDLTFAAQRRFARIATFKPDQFLDVVFRRESRKNLGFVLPDSPAQVVSGACIQSSVSIARKNVDEEKSHVED